MALRFHHALFLWPPEATQDTAINIDPSSSWTKDPDMTLRSSCAWMSPLPQVVLRLLRKYAFRTTVPPRRTSSSSHRVRCELRIRVNANTITGADGEKARLRSRFHISRQLQNSCLHFSEPGSSPDLGALETGLGWIAWACSPPAHFSLDSHFHPGQRRRGCRSSARKVPQESHRRTIAAGGWARGLHSQQLQRPSRRRDPPARPPRSPGAMPPRLSYGTARNPITRQAGRSRRPRAELGHAPGEARAVVRGRSVPPVPGRKELERAGAERHFTPKFPPLNRLELLSRARIRQEDQDRNPEGDIAAADGTALKWKGGL
ncbi:uncharacterized protein LOC113457098 [Microtus ochrogaster]|uniref:Uncharacterized protein LOC113457098 n=1 Tax=Microtus ochrogaster TaxID=79684 RepID=A0ABM1UBL6_MICOH|nr:uncharacterized protein LOC113457098 [Microtus ochrogaster]